MRRGVMRGVMPSNSAIGARRTALEFFAANARDNRSPRVPIAKARLVVSPGTPVPFAGDSSACAAKKEQAWRQAYQQRLPAALLVGFE
jgi:hypothetical protein